MALQLRRRLRLLLAIAIAIAGLLFCSVPFVQPAIAAYACPGCYGMTQLSARIYVEQGMSASDHAKIRDIVGCASRRVERFYGSFDRRPILLICATKACDRRTGGRGARAETYGSVFIRVSPRGINETILAHEFSHVEMHARFGPWRILQGALPAWLDEGVAVVVSEDERYLAPGATAAARCRAEPDGDARVGFFAWGSVAAKTPSLYAQAACRVMRWMEANGGRSGLLAALAETAEGKRQLP